VFHATERHSAPSENLGHVPSPTRPRSFSVLSSDDAVLDGRLRFQQPIAGYRVNVDTIFLAAFAAQGRRARLAVDLGAGVGLAALLLARLRAADEWILVESDARLARLATENLANEKVHGEVLCLDLEDAETLLGLSRRADLVVSNPPFFQEGRHRAPQNALKRRARMGKLEPFLAAARCALAGAKARAVFVYPATTLTEFFALAAEQGLVPKRLRLVHPFVDRPARVALVELRIARPGGLVVEPPLIEWERPGVPSPELTLLSSGKIADRE
jgi:tRNA1Val (adenine37-N6)-methyltransferase